MTRTISQSMSHILEELELENKTYVSSDEITVLAKKYGILTDPYKIVSRLNRSGWLLPTSHRGVWEFAPASMAGPYSRNEPLKDIRVFQKANPDIRCYICLQTAAWALGLADRIPAIKELAFEKIPRKRISEPIAAFRYTPVIEPRKEKNILCLVPESIIVHIASKPDIIRSWESAMEWIPDIVYETTTENILLELSDKNDSVKRRTGYLLQNMFPDASDTIYNNISKPSSKIRFGSRESAVRNDQKWMISDTVLPFSPKEMERVK